MSAELPSAGSEETRRSQARKAYVCDDCRVAIVPRQMYYAIRGVWDASWRTYRLCETCLHLRDQYNFWGEEGPAFGDLELALKEMLTDTPRDPIRRDLERFRARQKAYWLTNAWLTEPGGVNIQEFVEALDGIQVTRGFKLYNKKRAV